MPHCQAAQREKRRGWENRDFEEQYSAASGLVPAVAPPAEPLQNISAAPNAPKHAACGSNPGRVVPDASAKHLPNSAIARRQPPIICIFPATTFTHDTGAGKEEKGSGSPPRRMGSVFDLPLDTAATVLSAHESVCILQLS